MEGCRRNIRKKKINTQKFHYGLENKSVVDFIDAMLSSCLYEKTILLFSSPRAVPPKYILISCTLAVCYNSNQSVSMSNNSNNLLQDLIGKDSSV